MLSKEFHKRNLLFDYVTVLHGELILSGKGGLSVQHPIKLGLKIWTPYALSNGSETITSIKFIANGAYAVPLPIQLSYSDLTPPVASGEIYPQFVSGNSSGYMWYNDVSLEYLTSGNFSVTVLFSVNFSSQTIASTSNDVISVAGSDVTGQYFLGAIGTSVGFIIVALSILTVRPEYSTGNPEQAKPNREKEMDSSSKKSNTATVVLDNGKNNESPEKKDEQKGDQKSS